MNTFSFLAVILCVVPVNHVEDFQRRGKLNSPPLFLVQYNWRNVTKNGDIKKCILVDGLKDGGRPVQGDVVLVKSQGKLKDGTMVDDYPTLVFRVGEYEVIEGLDLVVQVSESEYPGRTWWYS